MDSSPDKVKINLPPSLQGRATRQSYADVAANSSFPVLAELMTPTWDDKGRPTWEGASLRFTVRNCQLTAILTCPTANLQTSCLITTLANCLREVEAFLTTEPVPWEPTYNVVKKARQELDRQKAELGLTRP